jgi:hypothetical protein
LSRGIVMPQRDTPLQNSPIIHSHAPCARTLTLGRQPRQWESPPIPLIVRPFRTPRVRFVSHSKRPSQRELHKKAARSDTPAVSSVSRRSDRPLHFSGMAVIRREIKRAVPKGNRSVDFGKLLRIKSLDFARSADRGILSSRKAHRPNLDWDNPGLLPCKSKQTTAVYVGPSSPSVCPTKTRFACSRYPAVSCQ